MSSDLFLDSIDFNLPDEKVYELLHSQLSECDNDKAREWIDNELYVIAPFFIDSEHAPLSLLFKGIVDRVNCDANLIINEFNENDFSLAQKGNLFYYFHSKSNSDINNGVQIQVWCKEKGVISDSMHSSIESAIGDCGMRTLEIVPLLVRDELELELLNAESKYRGWNS